VVVLVRLPDEERVVEALELFHDHRWVQNKPPVYEPQMAELLVVLQPWFEEEFARKRTRVPARTSAKVNKPLSKPAGGTGQARARRLVRERSGGLCEVCGVSRATNYQHRKARAHCSPEELWAVSNGLDVCGQGNVSGCHGLIHQNPAGAKDNGWTVPFWGSPRLAPVYRLNELVLLDDDGSFERVGGTGEEAAG
jgi:hypothetical protein